MGAARCRRKALGGAYGASPSWAWHYTIGRKIPLILQDGALRDTYMKDDPTEFSARLPHSIWLTTAETIDPTSVPALTLREAYGYDQQSFKLFTGGTWRIGYPLPHSLIITFEEILIRFPPSTIYGRWCRNLSHYGMNRKNWRLSLESLPVAGCRVEEWKDESWISHSIKTLSHDSEAPEYGMPGVVLMQKKSKYT